MIFSMHKHLNTLLQYQIIFGSDAKYTEKITESKKRAAYVAAVKPWINDLLL